MVWLATQPTPASTPAALTPTAIRRHRGRAARTRAGTGATTAVDSPAPAGSGGAPAGGVLAGAGRAARRVGNVVAAAGTGARRSRKRGPPAARTGAAAT